MESWHRPERVLELARIGIAAREGTATDEAESTLARHGARVELVRMPRLAISSSELRRRIREQRPIRYLVPDPVVELIAERGLYREPVTA
jgi:nicotinate-nucleotide adenylyltransferase